MTGRSQPRGARVARHASRAGAGATCALLALALSACTPKGVGQAGARDEVVLGASLPLSGALAGFGAFQKWGYEHAVAEVNAAGGLLVDGRRRKVRLIIRDDKTDPNAVASAVETLVSQDKVDALLGSCTPPLVIAGALVAERENVPMVTGCAPLMAFASAKRWTWTWDLFFADPDAAETPFRMLDDAGAKTNRRVFILHDNGPDGQAMGETLWPAMAKKHGYQVVGNAGFPIDTSDFDAAIQQAKAAGADVILVDAVTPQAVSIRKQMAAAGLTPKVLVMEKGAEPAQFGEALGPLAERTLVVGYWDPSLPYPGAKALGDAYARETGRGASQHIADSYTAARVLLDAMAAAGSVDRARVAAAIAATDRVYPVGRVKFGPNHTAPLTLTEMQWQDGTPRVVWPKDRAVAPVRIP